MSNFLRASTARENLKTKKFKNHQRKCKEDKSEKAIANREKERIRLAKRRARTYFKCKKCNFIGTYKRLQAHKKKNVCVEVAENNNRPSHGLNTCTNSRYAQK